MADKQYLTEVLELIKLSQLSGEGEKPRTKKLMKALLYDRDPSLLSDISEYFLIKAVPQLIEPDPFFPYPRPEDVKGELEIGSVIPTLDRFGFYKDQITRNVLSTGTHGKGKTTLLTVFIAGLYGMGIPFMIPEVAKIKYRNLIRRFPDIQVLRSRDFLFNPLKGPENTRPQVWLGDFIDAYCHGMELMMRSKSYLVEALEKAYRDLGVYDGKGEYPSLEDIKLILNEKLSRPGFRRDDILLRNIQRIAMLTILSDRRMEYSSGYQIEKLQEFPVVIEMGDQSEDMKNFNSNMLFTFNLRQRISEGVREGLRHVLIFDEAKRIFDANLEKNYQMGIPPIDFLVSYAREYGEGLILADQEATKLTDSIKANSNCKMSFMVGGKEIEEVSRMLGLSEEQKQVLMSLPTGCVIVKMDERYTRPFLVQVDNLQIDDVVSDEEVEEHSRKFVEYLNRDVRPRSTILIKKSEREVKPISQNAEEWLLHMARAPFLSIKERTEALNMTNYVANKVTKELELKGYAKRVRIYTGRPGHPFILMDFTKKGDEYMNSVGVKITKKGRGGIRHQFWQHKISEYFERRGEKAIIEPNIEGMYADILVIDPDGGRTAVEVALSADNQAWNIVRDLEHFDGVIVATETRSMIEKIKAEVRTALSHEDLKKVRFHLLGDFLP